MASEAKVAANRRNARRSTGPRSVAGREVVAGNALRHGLTAQQVVLFDESATDFAEYHAALSTALDPQDAVEEALVERIVLCAWRLRRACRAEAAVVNARAAELARWTKAGLGAALPSSAVETVARYETTLDRSLRRSYAMLERHQARRRGEPVAAPILVDVEGVDIGAHETAAPRLSDEHENCETKPNLAAGPM